MTERDLHALAAYVEVPPERDLAAAVRARIGTRRPRPGRLVVALAAVVLAIAVTFAVPPARGQILRWLGLGNARIEFVDRLPTVSPGRPIDLGKPTSLEDAQARVPYHVLTSSLLGRPRTVYLLDDQVASAYGDRKLIVTQSRGTFFTKQVGPGTHVQQFALDGLPALWISGSPHLFGYIGANGHPRPVDLHLAGNALIWQHGELTLRLEGRLTREEAVRVARSFR